ncbi:MAG: aminotransferase class I/II-fold pyridoxal phosphate-dependent enzyme [Lachnospiraceae bacterium]|nr:aminotransferase class I/II-fold pyridoxal phosphate-dependent enzyme [Lachnospiraceae bacterium]
MKHGGDIYDHRVELDFSVNLNPLGTPDAILRSVERAKDRIGVYPEYTQDSLRNLIADTLGIRPDSVYAGSGASELLMAAVRALQPKKALLFEPAFSGYAHALTAAGCEMIRHPLFEENGFVLTEEDLAALNEDIDVVFVCDPANPSGLNIGDDVQLKLLERAEQNHAAVILDESFFPLSDQAYDRGNGKQAGDRAEARLKRFSHLIILRSLTKLFAMPGIRAGYAIASPELIAAVAMQLPEWNLSVVAEEAIRAGMEVLKETDFAKSSIAMIQRERSYLADRLKECGLTVYESHAPYLLFTGPQNLYEALLARGILIRDCSDFYGLEKGYFRVAVRDRTDNEKLAEALRMILCR